MVHGSMFETLASDFTQKYLGIAHDVGILRCNPPNETSPYVKMPAVSDSVKSSLSFVWEDSSKSEYQDCSQKGDAKPSSPKDSPGPDLCQDIIAQLQNDYKELEALRDMPSVPVPDPSSKATRSSFVKTITSQSFDVITRDTDVSASVLNKEQNKSGVPLDVKSSTMENKQVVRDVKLRRQSIRSLSSNSDADCLLQASANSNPRPQPATGEDRTQTAESTNNLDNQDLDQEGGEFRGVQREYRTKRMFISGIADTVKRDRIGEYLLDKGVRTSVIRIFSSSRKGTVSARINVFKEDLEKIEAKHFWPRGVSCRPWMTRNVFMSHFEKPDEQDDD